MEDRHNDYMHNAFFISITDSEGMDLLIDATTKLLAPRITISMYFPWTDSGS